MTISCKTREMHLYFCVRGCLCIYFWYIRAVCEHLLHSSCIWCGGVLHLSPCHAKVNTYACSSLGAKICTSTAWHAVLLHTCMEIDQAENCLLFLIITRRLLRCTGCMHFSKASSIRHMFTLPPQREGGPTGVHQIREENKVTPEWGNELSVLTWRRWMRRQVEPEGIFSLLLTLSRYRINYSPSELCSVAESTDRAYSVLPLSGSVSIWCFICFPEALLFAVGNSSSCQ